MQCTYPRKVAMESDSVNGPLREFFFCKSHNCNRMQRFAQRSAHTHIICAKKGPRGEIIEK